LFDHLVNSDLSTSDTSVERLASEAQVLMGAGTVTTAQSMSHLVVNVLLRPGVEKQLREEFAVLMKHLGEAYLPEAQELEKLPYLQACVREGQQYAQCAPAVDQASHAYEIQSQSWIDAPAATCLARCGSRVQ
jgi:cytochrome P450